MSESQSSKCPHCGRSLKPEEFEWLDAGTLFIRGEEIKLTAGEALMMRSVIDAYPRYASKKKIALEMWLQEWRFPDTWNNLISVYASRIRKKLPHLIHLVSKTGPYSLGYRLEIQNGASVPERGLRNPEA